MRHAPMLGSSTLSYLKHLESIPIYATWKRRETVHEELYNITYTQAHLTVLPFHRIKQVTIPLCLTQEDIQLQPCMFPTLNE